MPSFTYQARTRSGSPQNGREEAASATELVTRLRERGWLVISIREVVSGGSLRSLNPARLLRVRSMDVEFALQQMAVMLRSGLTLLTSLRAAAEHATRPRMRDALNQVADRIQAGATLTDALAQHRCFPHLVVQLIRVGEATGTLEEVMTRAAEALERRRRLITQMISALLYPLIVLIAAIGVASLLIFYVIPKLQTMLSTLGRKLPPLTQHLLDVSTFLMTYGQQIGIALIALILSGVMVYAWPPGRMWIDKKCLRLPVVGRILRLAATVQFAHGLGVMLRSGVSLVEGLRTVAALHRNHYITRIVADARESVLGGGSLAPALTIAGGFSPMLPRMVAVGESSGTLDDVLGEVATFYEAQLQATIRWFSVIIEPIIILVVGSIVGFVYIAFFMALYSIAGNF